MTLPFRALIVVATITLAGCAASLPPLSAGAERVEVVKGDANLDEYEEIGPIEAAHGSGCGGFGAKGSYAGSIAALKNRAVQMGADKVRIDVAEPPHQEYGCYDNEYVLSGVAYRRRGIAKSEKQPEVVIERPPELVSGPIDVGAERSLATAVPILATWKGRTINVQLVDGAVVSGVLDWVGDRSILVITSEGSRRLDLVSDAMRCVLVPPPQDE